MRAFITGGTGYVGGAVLRAFVDDGWEVGALVRDHLRDEQLRLAGAMPVTGRLQDPETYRSFCASADAVVHCAFESPDLDTLAASEILGALLGEGGKRTFIHTSGVWVLGNTRDEVDESASTNRPAALSTWRPPLEKSVLSQAQLESKYAGAKRGQGTARYSCELDADKLEPLGIDYGGQVPELFRELRIDEFEPAGVDHDRWAVHLHQRSVAELEPSRVS